MARLKEEGLSLREIAERLGTSYGKVRYEWSKWRKYAAPLDSDEADFIYENYEKDRLAALPRDPWTIYTYWELTASRIQMAESHFGKSWGEIPKALRVYDVNTMEFRGDEANRIWQIDVGTEADHWFIRGLQPDCSYVVDFGTRTGDGGFFSLLRSSGVKLPPDRPYDPQQVREAFAPPPEAGSKSAGAWEAPGWMEKFTGYSLHP